MLKNSPPKPFEVHFPPSLLDAWRNDKIVFFCGAGVSNAHPSGLPLFRELARQLSKDVRDIDPEEKHVTTSLAQSLKQAYVNKRYDQMMDMLATLDDNGKRLDAAELGKRKKKLHDALRSILHLENLNASELHNLVSKAAKTPNGAQRIVTTNFDCLFEKTDEKLKEDHVYCAPRLPVVRSNRWQTGLVKLHGCISGEYRDLVLTSSSYGLAYFQDGWASGFLKELFHHYCVVFIGYSLSDVVVEYILHAYGSLKAEQSAGGVQLQPAYIFLERKSDEEESAYQDARMEMMGIEPIYYFNEDNTHNELTLKIQKLAGYCTRSPDDVRAEIDRLVQMKSDNPEAIRDIATWFEHDPELSIRYFCELADETWLSFMVDQLKEHFQILIGDCPLSRSGFESKNTWHVMEWIIKHCNKQTIVKHVLDAGGFLHPRLRHNLSSTLSKQVYMKEPVRRIWEILLQPDMLLKRTFLGLGDSFALREVLSKTDIALPLPILLQQRIVRLLTPTLKIDMSRYLWRSLKFLDEQEVEQELCIKSPSDVFQVMLSEQADLAVLEVVEFLANNTIWIQSFANLVLGLVEQMYNNLELIGCDAPWLNRNLEPLYTMANACVGVFDHENPKMAAYLRQKIEQRKPLERGIMERGEPEPEEIISDASFEEAWNARNAEQLSMWLQKKDASEESYQSANDVAAHLLRKLKAEPDSYYDKTERLSTQHIFSKAWWTIFLRTAVSDADFIPDWEKLARLALCMPEDMCRKMLWYICRAIEKAARGNKHSSALSNDTFWQWWKSMLPLAQSIEMEREEDDITTAALNHPLGTLSESLIARLWHETEGRKERTIEAVWQSRLEILLENSAGSKAAWVMLTGELPILLQVLPSWTESQIVPLFDWSRGNEDMPIHPIQAWSRFMYHPQLTKPVKDSLLDFFVKGMKSDAIHAWKDGSSSGLLRNYLSCVAYLLVAKCFSASQHSIIVAALRQNDVYAAELIEHWKMGFKFREEEGWDKEYRADALALLAQHADIIQGSAVQYAAALIVSLNDEELNQYGDTLIAVLSGNGRQDFWSVSHTLLKSHDDPTLSNAAIWNHPERLLALLTNLLLPSQIELSYKEDLKIILRHLEERLINANDERFVELKRCAEA